MPLYNFECECKHKFSKLIKMSDYIIGMTAKCPECNKDASRGDLTAPVIVNNTSKHISDTNKHNKKMNKRLKKREERIKKMPHKQAKDFRNLSKIVTKGKF